MTKITKIILGGLVFGVAVSSAISASQEDLFISNAKKQHQTMMDSIKAVSKVKASKKDEFIKINQKYLDEFTQSYEVLTSEEKTQIVSSTLTKALNPNEFENFDIDSWVNTACPRLDIESNKVINISKL